jgi:hypothetical protein
MKFLYSFFYILTICILLQKEAAAQGCVAIRSTGGVCTMSNHPDSISSPEGNWIFNANNRYFKSFRHFKGRDEQEERLELNTEVINYQYALDLSLTRVINNRWSVMIDIPLLFNKRSSLYEHGLINGKNNFNQRHFMESTGLGDIRLAAYRWLLNPEKYHKANIQLGLGLKLPTGDYDYKDYWQNVGPNGTQELRTVDQSIQLGDGGTGVTAELNAFYNLAKSFGLYGNFFYLSNPREQNGVRTYRETLTPVLAGEAIMSVPDQYMARAGVNYSIKDLFLTAGARFEGIPVHDLIGGSGDFRRPGYIWSVEPGVTYKLKKAYLYATVPVAIERNRTQSVTDKARSTPTVKAQGDAAFADYSVNLGITFKF